MRPVKTYDYIVVLERPSYYKYVDLVSQLMFFIALAVFSFESYQSFYLHKGTGLSTDKLAMRALSTAIVLGWWFYCHNQSKRGVQPFYRFGLMIAAWGWFTIPEGGYFAAAYLIAAAIEKPVKLLPEVAFDQEEIVLNSFPQKKYLWSEVSNVILKHGLLTIDLYNNKVFQKEVDAEVSPETEKEFNNFCRERLGKSTI